MTTAEDSNRRTCPSVVASRSGGYATRMLPDFGRYEALAKIATGGMATVYRGRVVGEGGFERLVALKLLHPHISNDPEFVAMFLDEARLAARIRHPNVVATIDIQKTPTSLFIVMDYVDGPTLHDVRKHLKRHRGRIPIGITVRLFVDILNGLQEAHDLEDDDGAPLNLVHRDLSPHNVLVGADGVAKITDFGVAKAEARISSTRRGQLKGKIAYMPPEQILAEPVSRATDIYSVGVCLWEALVGRRLFRAPNAGAMVHQILAGEAPSPREQNLQVPEPIAQIVVKAIQSQPGARYADALEMADALEDAANASSVDIPRAREVAQFIKTIKVALASKGEAAKDSAEAQSAPSSLSGPSSGSGVSRPSLPSIGTGPSHPRTEASETSQPSGVSKPSMLGSSSSPADEDKPVRPLSKSGPPPRPRPGGLLPLVPNKSTSTSKPKAPPAEPVVPPPPRMPPRSLIEDDTTTQIDDVDEAPAVEPMAAEDVSSPSGVTGPSLTKTDASYSLAPPPSRHGVIAIGVAGAFAVLVLGAVLLGRPSNETSRGGPAATSSTATAPPSSQAAMDAPATNDAADAPQPTPSSSAAAATSTTKTEDKQVNKTKKRPKTARGHRRVRPPPPPPPSQFHPDEL